VQEISLFHAELLRLLKGQVEKRVQEQGWDPGSDECLKALLQRLTEPNHQTPLDEVIELYQNFFRDKGVVYLEKVLMEAFPEKDFVELGLWRYFPRIYRGLPRMYHRNFPSQSYVKHPFTHLPSLKKHACIPALYSLYSTCEIAGKVTLFTWVINDGLGDYIAASEVLRLLKTRFADLALHFVALVPETMADRLLRPENSILIAYAKDCPLEAVSPEVLSLLRSSDLIVQLPTYYPHFDSMVDKLKGMDGGTMPTIESVGEYGFLESNWFHPKSHNHSMGLHFLEKGVLVRKPLEASWRDISNPDLLRMRNPENLFYLAYLSTQIGGAIYLHALLKSLQQDDRSIDLCVPDLGWFLQFVERQKQKGKEILEWELGVQEIEIHLGDRLHLIPISASGKKLRILSPKELSQNDFRALLSLSGNWVGIRGNQSFSEAISQGKTFFYDGREHARYFLKDLVALVENRLPEYQGTLHCIRGMTSGFLYNLPIQEEEWVDEAFFQTVEEWPTLALQLGLSLQDPQTYEGFQRLSQIIIQEHSANRFLRHFVQRALTLRKYPDMEQQEAENIGKFISGAATLRGLIESHRNVMRSYSKTGG